MMKQGILVALVQDKPGVLEEAVSLYRRRGFNLKSLTVGPCERPGFSRMTIVVEVDEEYEQGLEQALRQLEKLVSVAEVHDITRRNYASQETVLVKVPMGADRYFRIASGLLKVWKVESKIVSSNHRYIVFSVSGEINQVEKAIDYLRGIGTKIIELARSGLVALRLEE
jgi:acetolactate synthase I/III small subunit